MSQNESKIMDLKIKLKRSKKLKKVDGFSKHKMSNKIYESKRSRLYLPNIYLTALMPLHQSAKTQRHTRTTTSLEQHYIEEHK
jgi:hypothetical protein